MSYKAVQGKKMAYLEFESKSTPGKKYFVTLFVNPLHDFIKQCDKHSTTRWINALPHQVLWVCTCRSFTMGRAAAGLNPFEHPCVHIAEVLSTIKQVRKKLEDLTHANKGMAQGTKEKKKEKGKTKKAKRTF